MVVVDNGKQRLHRREVVIWRPPLQQLDHGTPYTPDIGGRCRTGELYDLRGHPVRRADHLRLLVRTGQSACGHTKVGKLDGSILGGQNVGALDVSVDDTLVVQVVQALKDLSHVNADQVLRKLSIGLADGVKGAILAVPAHRQLSAPSS